jgi:hypothetical protein
MGMSCARCMDRMRKLCRTRLDPDRIITFMINAEGAPTRTLTIVLPESDWRALRAAEPDAVAWLQARIRERLAAPETQQRAYAAPPPATPADTFWGDDEY